MSRARQKLVISLVVVAVYTLLPLFAGAPASAPAVFRTLVGGVPLSAWFVVLLLLAFPALTWMMLSSSLAADTDGDRS